MGHSSLIDRLRAYLAWQESPQFEPCPRCNGRGYHHGFGEHGHDPDWCEKCGGPGEQPTEPGTWSPDDLIAEVVDAFCGESEHHASASVDEQTPDPQDS